MPFSNRTLFGAMAPFLFVAAARLASGAASPQSLETVDEALKAAQAAHEPVLIDFSALWCHSCWWMKNNVMNGPLWDELMKHVVYVESDSDLPDGAAWMDKLHIEGLPTYVVLNADGSELGRIVGEAPADEFYRRVDGLARGADTLTALQTKAASGTPDDVAKLLDAYGARNDYTGASAWYSALPAALKRRSDKDAKVVASLETMSMDFERHKMSEEKSAATKATLAKSCLAHGQKAVAAKPEYDGLIHLIDGLTECSDGLPTARRHQILDAPLADAASKLDTEKLSKHPLPPGTREAIYYLADSNKVLGNRAVADAFYARAITAYRAQMNNGTGGLDLKKDRSAADDLLSLYRFAHREDEKRSLLKELADTYSEDSNYSLSYGTLMVKENHPDLALPYLEHAASIAHGRYVLLVANQRSKALLALMRAPEAKQVVAEALSASGSAFPKDQEALRKTIDETGKRSTKKS